MSNLEKDIQFIKGVGPAKAKLFSNIGINNLHDLITYYPRTYEDRTNSVNILDTPDGEDVLIRAKVMTRMVEIPTNSGLKIYKITVADESGSCQVTWYNQSYLKNMFSVGSIYKFYGKMTNNFGRREMSSPVFDKDGENNNTGKIIPIYNLTYGLTQNTIRKVIENGVREAKDEIEETLPYYILKSYNLMGLREATIKIHFPQSFEDFENARRRLAFEELLLMQISLFNLKNQYTLEKGVVFDKKVSLYDVINNLPFKLTNAQIRVLEEIERDMESNKNMNRLVQGDVGAGKTILSIIAAYKAVKSGYQVAVMAPTAILATQHLNNFKNILEQYDIRCELLVSGLTKKAKTELLDDLKQGKINIIIGTHALLEDNVEFKNLGFVVTDEQHRFGVRQRGILAEKGQNPDIIVMTATPIPRTLALILFGDLDISIVDELPPNRQPVETFAVGKSMENRVNVFIAKQIQEGRQAYIVCPLVEENEEIDAKSVMELVDKYKNEVFSEFRVEHLHGKMKPKEKNEIMDRFKNGGVDILISTTVIEVGVDVPNATMMVIENAERFGLAQLHQLRGRVGRGKYKSFCILKYKGNSDIIRERMKVMVETSDGFVISEKDLELRGTGEFFGTRQHGIPDFKVANLFQDMDLLKMVQAVAVKILEEDPKLEKEENEMLKKNLTKTVYL